LFGVRRFTAVFPELLRGVSFSESIQIFSKLLTKY